MSEESISDSKEETKLEPIRWSRPAITISIVLGLAAIVMTGLFVINEYYVPGETSFYQAVSEPGSLSVSPNSGLATHEEITDNAYQILSTSNQELLASIPALVTGQNTLTEQVTAIASAMDSLSSDLSDFRSEMDNTWHDKNQTFNQLSRSAVDTKAKISLLEQKLNSLGESIAAVKQQTVQKIRSAVSKPVSPTQSKPPFKLLSVQVWNSNPVAIIQYKDTQLGLGINEKLAGWSIDSILAPDCLQVSHQKHSVKLCL